jgi:hypothetical protein
VSLTVGEVVPFEAPPTIFGGVFDPWWFVLRTHLQKEAAACSWLGRQGVEALVPDRAGVAAEARLAAASGDGREAGRAQLRLRALPR